MQHWIEDRLPALFNEAIDILVKDNSFVLEVQSKDPKDALRGYPRMAEDGKISWSASAKSILRLINACNKPYYGAFCNYEGEELKIWDAELVDDDERYLAINGQVCDTNKNDDSILVICGDGKLKINSVEYKGKEMKARALIKSIRKRLT